MKNFILRAMNIGQCLFFFCFAAIAASWELSYQTPTSCQFINALQVYNGKLFAGTCCNTEIFVYNGTDWAVNTQLDNSNGHVHCLAVFDDKLYAGTNYYDFNDYRNKGRVWVYNGSTWSISQDWLHDNTVHHIFCLAVYNGKLYAGTGDIGKIRVFDGSIWNDEFNTGQTNVNCMAVYDGKLYAGTYKHHYTNQGNIYVLDINGWSLAYATGEGSIDALEVYDGMLYAGSGGNGRLFSFNGNSWEVAHDFEEVSISSLSEYKGKLFAGTMNGAKIYVFNGTSWELSYGTEELNFLSMGKFGNSLFAGTSLNGRIYEYEELSCNRYEIRIIGTLGGEMSIANDINDNGQIVGYSKISPDLYHDRHAFLYDSNGMQDLGTLSGDNESYANAIDNSGRIVGSSKGTWGSHKAFLYENGQMAELGTLGGYVSITLDINRFGIAVGSSNYETNAAGGFLYKDGIMHGLPGFRSAISINDNQDICGINFDGSGPSRGIVYWKSDNIRIDIGTLGGSMCNPYAISNNGHVVGVSETSNGERHAFLYKDEVLTDLGTLGGNTSEAFDVNDHGQIVGYSTLANGEIHAFIYENGIMKDLGTYCGGSYSLANGVNNNGYIVGHAQVPFGNNQEPCDIAVLWKPVFCNTAPTANAGPDQSGHYGDLITLDGSGSTDPDNNYPLTYSWVMLEKPEGSSAVIAEPTCVNPTFEVDLMGDYMISLTVTDNLGGTSAPDQVTISTINAKPIADAGPDKSVQQVGTVVQIDGTQSWDPDGDNITFLWEITSKPDGSAASISDPQSGTTSIIPDVYGEYTISLVVNDLWESSEPDYVVISFENIKPVADAGNNISCMAGYTVELNGSGSSDENGDALTYNWQIVSKPDGSNGSIPDETLVATSLTTDEPGEYIISLVVNDGLVNSEPSIMTIAAVSIHDVLTEKLQETSNGISLLPEDVFKNRNMGKTLTNKINAVLLKIENELYQEAYNQLNNDILNKTNGCASEGSPDKNDWIRECEAQSHVMPLINQAIDILEDLL